MTDPTSALPTKYCDACGAIIDGRATKCPSCSAVQRRPGQPAAVATYGATEKRIVPALVLAVLLPFGAHRLYVGKIGTAILFLCTLGGLGLWWLYDVVMLTTGNFRDKEGNRITEWT